MKKLSKILCICVCAVMLLALPACGEEGGTNIDQTAYAPAWERPTTVAPNTTTTAEETTVTEVTTVAEEPVITTRRTGERPAFEQTTQMRNITSAQLLTQIVAGINIGGSFDGSGLPENSTIYDFETHFGNPVLTRDFIEIVRASGFNAIRLPVSWGGHMNENHEVSGEWLDRIEYIVQFALERRMYVILNSQNDQSWLTTNNRNFRQTRERFEGMWSSIARRFRDYNDRLLFEGFGEILKAENDRSSPSRSDLRNTNELNQLFVDTVRNTGGNNRRRHLIVSTYGSKVSGYIMEGFTIPQDSIRNRIIAKVNIFLPGDFALAEDRAAAWGSAEDRQYITDVLMSVHRHFSGQNIPVIIGEFGAVNKRNELARANYAEHFIREAFNLYMVCFWWDDGQAFRLFDRQIAVGVHPLIINSIVTSTW